ncbi:MAG: tetratricopeptide repeat protein [Deltaproteobacteria bacterium]|nr:tetratricopeptide repeat protein [Deltaproteobacteria bacterium]
MLFGVGAAAALTVWPAHYAHALGADEAAQAAQRSIADAQNEVPSIQRAIATAKTAVRFPAQRIAEGDLLLRNKDYDRAAIVFNEVIEKYADNPTVHAEASFLLGETYYRSKQLLSARRVFRRVVETGQSGRMAAYQPEALARLVDIALRTRDLRELDEIFAKMSQVPSAKVESILAYSRGRGLLAKKDFSGARQSLSSVPATSPYHHQARYLLALAAVKEAQASAPAEAPKSEAPKTEAAKTDAAKAAQAANRGRYAQAIEAFREVTRLPPDTPEHKHVVDLSWMAIGRLFYETDQWNAAAEAYNHVDRSSPEFGTMLYELASVYVRLGDVQRAQRALEVLSIADPDSSDIAEGSLLRGDLLLRTGQFPKSLETYESVHKQYEPMRLKVDSFLGATNDPAVYYDKLRTEQLEITSEGTQLPPLAVQWAREAEDGPEAFAVLDEVVKTRNLIKQSQALVDKLGVLMGAPNRIRAFPELRAGEQRAIGIINSLMKARVTLAEGLDDVEDSRLSGEIAAVREQRRALQGQVLSLPVSDADFMQLDEQASKEWNTLSQKVQQLTLQIDTLQSIVNALRRVLREGPAQGVVRDAVSQRRLEDELAANERDIALYRARVAEVHKMVDTGRMAAGFGDQKFTQDASLRAQFKQLLAREVQLATQGSGGGKAVAYAIRIAPMLGQADQVDDAVNNMRADIARQVQKKTKEMQELVYQESSKILDYAAKLDTLDQEARLVVGQVAMRNFGLVRDRLKNIVLRADVGVTEEAWEVREEQVTRVRNLLTERARSERLLDEELREVLDDASDEPGGAKQ